MSRNREIAKRAMMKDEKMKKGFHDFPILFVHFLPYIFLSFLPSLLLSLDFRTTAETMDKQLQRISRLARVDQRNSTCSRARLSGISHGRYCPICSHYNWKCHEKGTEKEVVKDERRERERGKNESDSIFVWYLSLFFFFFSLSLSSLVLLFPSSTSELSFSLSFYHLSPFFRTRLSYSRSLYSWNKLASKKRWNSPRASRRTICIFLTRTEWWKNTDRRWRSSKIITKCDICSTQSKFCHEEINW